MKQCFSRVLTLLKRLILAHLWRTLKPYVRERKYSSSRRKRRRSKHLEYSILEVSQYDTKSIKSSRKRAKATRSQRD